MAIDLSQTNGGADDYKAQLQEKRSLYMTMGLLKRLSRKDIQPRNTSKYWRQFEPVSDQIRNAIRSIRTPTEIDDGDGPGGYYVVEWRVLPSGPPKAEHEGGCGCACGCACGG